MPSLQLWLRNRSDASCSQEATVHQNQFPPRQSVGIPMECTTGVRPSTRNLCLFLSNPTQWVAYNQDSPFLADAPKDRKSWADNNKPQFRTQTQMSRVGSQDEAVRSAATGRLESTQPPYSIHRRAPTVKKYLIWQKLVTKSQKMNLY